MCLTCGQPFGLATGAPLPPPSPSPRNGAPPAPAKSSSPIVWIAVGVLATIMLLGAGAVVVLLRAPSNPNTPGAVDASAAPLLLAVDAAPSPSSSSSGSASASASAPPKPPPLTDEERDDLVGNYTCAMDDTPAFPCRIAGGTLEKLGGSQRFRGPIKKLPDGNLSFSGTFFCPFGDCTHPVACTFVRQAPGRYVGRFGPNSIPGGGPGGERVVLIKVR